MPTDRRLFHAGIERRATYRGVEKGLGSLRCHSILFLISCFHCSSSRGVADKREVTQMEIEMKIRGLMMDPVTNVPIVILKGVERDALLPIWVGVYEANAIALEIEKIAT